MFKRFLYIFLFLLAGVAAFAQQYPVQGSLAIASPYPANLSDYANSNIQNVVLNLTLTDLNMANKRVRLKVFIQTQNATIAQSIDNVSGEPLIMLDGGIPQRFTNAELAHYFRLENLQGINPDGYARSLPEGVYTIGFEVYDYFTGNKLSGRIGQTFWIIINDPPLLNTPTDKSKIADFTSGSRGNGGIIFNWTPRSSQVSNTEYEFTLCELWDPAGDPYQQFMSAIPKYQTTVSNSTTLIYDQAQPSLISGYTYAWRVRAKAKAGFEDVGLYRNDGYSNLFTFLYGDPCPAPQSLTLEAKTSDAIAATWDAPVGATTGGIRFKIAYRKYSAAGQWSWAETETSDLFRTISNLEPATEYEIKVGVSCAPPSGELEGVVFTPSQRATTLAAGQMSGIECGKEPTIDLSQQTLLTLLKAGDVVMANDFPTTISSVTGTSQGWSGEGWTKVPWLGDARIHVKYNNIKVNTDYKLIDGSFITTYDPTGKNIGDIDKTIDDAVGLYTGGTDVGKVVTGDAATTYTVPYTITPADTIGSTFTANTTGGGTITLGNGQTLTVSNLPTTVQDAAGTVYQADDKGKLTKVGTNSSNAGAMLATANLTVVDASKGTVTFAPTSDMKYAFDAWQKGYDGNSAWSKRYETLPLSGGAKGGSYRVSSKLMVPGEADKVLAIVNLNNKNLVADSVRFVNAKGTLFEKKKITDNSYELSLVGGPAGDAQEVYALYSTGGKTYTLGKLMVATYEPKTINLALVPVNDAPLDSKAIAAELKKVYEPLGINFNLTPKDNFKYKALETASLKVEGSGLLSVYTEQMKALNRAYVDSLGSAYDATTVYMFALKQGAGKDEGKTILGDTPRGKQFGYLFTQGQTGVQQGLTAAHEIGHGVFQLQHTFSYSGMDNATFSAANVMNYPAGEALSKLQWDLMHDQGLVISVFETDKGAESFTNVLPEQKDGVMYRLDKAMNFVSPSGKIVQLPTDALVKFYCIDINSCQTQGLLVGFVINNKEFVARYSDIQNPNGDFNGYFEKVNGKTSNNPYINAYAPLTVGKNKISFIQEDYLDNGETRIRIITEEQTIIQENIEKKGGIFAGRKYHPFSYNSQTTVAGTEEKVFASNCDNITKNSQTIGNGSCIIKLKKVGDKWQVDTVVLDDSKANSKTKDQKIKIEAMLKQLAVEKLNELGLEGKTSAKISTETEDDGEFYVKDMNGREWLATLAHLGENVWENATLPESYWNKDKDYSQSTVHLPPTLSGVSDGVVDQITQYPQLIKLGYDVATKEEVRTGIWNAVKNITPNGAISMIKNAVKNKVEEYNFSDKPWKGYHAVGKDGVTVLTMLTGVGLVKDGEKAVENGANETGETIRRNAINDVENEAVQLSKEVIELSEKNITNSGVTVLGDYIPNGGYIKKAQDMGASYFDIGNKWDVLSDAERKAANFHFLDVIADKGDQIIMSVEKLKILGSSTQKEIEYLTTKKGYKWVNQWSLKK